MFLLILLVLSSPDWTQQHLTYPVDYCKLAAVCIHDNRMVCATTEDGCSRRTFIDQCDMYEYNCDFGARYRKYTGVQTATCKGKQDFRCN
ncbi:uncharacterized protein LOC113499288 isoform X2 [Trichoplusia ni]|uniref:Uncharacterized protein LOC113499288 isoform X2 n=1 Tax=Trichoplusia ni TaxID=7111 RepID=A0A7E5W4H4_TRINI|nr:uncharacterized protein LOC113499288 isoform X2 [Trichoplusia ni]